MSCVSQPFKNRCSHVYGFLISLSLNSSAKKKGLTFALFMWSKSLIVRYAVKDIKFEGNRREMADQRGFHDLSVEENKKRLMPCCSWEVWRLGKPSSVKLLVVMVKKDKNSWLTGNKQESEIMTTRHSASDAKWWVSLERLLCQQTWTAY